MDNNVLTRAGTSIKKFVSVLSQTTQLLSALLSLLVLLGVGATVLGFLKNNLSLLSVGIAVFIITSLSFILLHAFLVESSISRKWRGIGYPMPLNSDDSGVKLQLKEIVYGYHSNDRIYQRKRFQVYALRDGVSSFSDRYFWTGDGECDLSLLSPGFEITNPRKIEFWNYFDVSFPHPLRKGEVADFTIQWDLIDETGKAERFLSTMIDVDTEYLIMQVVLPETLKPSKVLCHEFSNYIDNLPIATKEVPWDLATQSIRYEVPRPMKGRKYLIRWY